TDDCKKASERITANKKGPVYRASLWNKTWNWHRIGTGLHKEHLELFVARIGRILSIRAVRPNLLRSASSLSKSRQEISPIGFFRKTMEAMAPFPERLTSAESALLRNASDSNTAAKTAANVLLPVTLQRPSALLRLAIAGRHLAGPTNRLNTL